MKWGDLRGLFVGVAWKHLTAHEVDPRVSNGHEFQGINAVRQILGDTDREFVATYMLLSDDGEKMQTIRSRAKWYDSRRDQAHRSAEWRLYYPADAGQVQNWLSAGDLMVIALTHDGELALMLAPSGSTREMQLRMLFSIDPERDAGFRVRRFTSEQALGFVAASIVEELGLGPVETPQGIGADLAQALADEMINEYPEFLPSGRVVSSLVRSRLGDAGVHEDPDGALMLWIETEAALFRLWEDRRIARRLHDGFLLVDGTPDVQGYRDFSMSLRQSRVSRAGGALEEHFEDILRAHGIRYSAQPRIDEGERPDFLFPGKVEYEDDRFPSSNLRMLGVKFTAKDRWRQVLSEARRIERKHLLTLESSISVPQLNLMRLQNLQLVIPMPVQALYAAESRTRLMSVLAFLSEVKALQ